MAAFREHGRPTASLEQQIQKAHAVMDVLDRHGIALTTATDKLLEDGIVQFRRALDRLLTTVEHMSVRPSAVRANG
jgi:hypothetical protein